MGLFENLEAEVKEGLEKGGADAVMKLLEKLGPVPDEVKAKITSEMNPENLKKWMEMAKEAGSIDKFLEQFKK